METRTARRYTFQLDVKTNSATDWTNYGEVHPYYNEMKHKYTRKEDEMYYEEDFSAQYTFHGDEFDDIVAMPISTMFRLSVYDNGVLMISGQFRRADGETDINHRTLTIKIGIDSEYKSLVYGKADERELSDLKPEQGKLSLEVSPIMQMYTIGDDELYTIDAGGGVTTRDVAPITEQSQLGSGWFTWREYHVAIYEGDYKGLYVQESVEKTQVARDITYYYHLKGLLADGIPNGYEIVIHVEDGEEDTIEHLNIAYSGGAAIDQTPNIILPVNTDINGVLYFTQSRPIATISRSDFNFRVLYGSFTSDTSVGDYIPVSTDDVFFAGNAYGRIAIRIPEIYPLQKRIMTTTNEEDGECLVKDNKEVYYYARDYATRDLEFLTSQGVCKWRWSKLYDFTSESARGGKKLAVQYRMPTDWLSRFQQGGASYIQPYTQPNKDWYILTSVIEKLAHWCSKKIFFNDRRSSGGGCDSYFLFGVPYESESSREARKNIINNMEWGKLMILQKSNLIQFDYDTASANNKITLDQVFNLLKNAFNCYWDLYTAEDGEKHLRIEHVSFYMNGRTYDTDTRTPIDLTSVICQRNGRPMSMNTNRWTYDQSKMCNRISFSWQDEQSREFKGYAMEVPDEYNLFSDAKTEERPIEWFSSDIDYMLSNKESVVMDGFVIAQSADWDSQTINKYNYVKGNTIKTLNNGQLAMVFLQRAFMIWDIYAPKVRIDREASPYTDVVMTSKVRELKTSYRIGKTDNADPYDVYQAEITDLEGNKLIGDVKEISNDCTCEWIEATLMFDCEADVGWKQGGSKIVTKPITDFDRDRVIGDSTELVTKDKYVDDYGYGIMDYVEDLVDSGELQKIEGSYVINDDYWSGGDYSRDDIIDFIHAKENCSMQNLKDEFDNCEGLVNVMIKGGLLSVNGEEIFVTFNNQDIIDYIKQLGGATKAELVTYFNTIVNENNMIELEKLEMVYYEDLTYKASYLDEYPDGIKEVRRFMVKYGDGHKVEVAIVEENNMQGLFDYFVFKEQVSKSETYYTLLIN